MADNVPITAGAGTSVAADDISGVYYQRVKLSVGPDGQAVDFAYPATPAAYNLTLTNANTEYSQALPSNCRGFVFRCRTSVDVRFAFATGKVATPTAPYLTLPADCAYSKDGIYLSSVTLYFASSTAGVVVEIEAWA